MCAHTHTQTLPCVAAPIAAGVCTVSLKWFRFHNQTTNDHGGSTRLNVISASASAPANVSASVSSGNSNSSTGGTNVCQACQKFALFVAHNFLINFLPDADAAHRSEMIYVHMRARVCVCVWQLLRLRRRRRRCQQQRVILSLSHLIVVVVHCRHWRHIRAQSAMPPYTVGQCGSNTSQKLLLTNTHTHRLTHTAIEGMQSIIVSVRVSVSDNCPLNGFRWIWQLIICVTCGSQWSWQIITHFWGGASREPKIRIRLIHLGGNGIAHCLSWLTFLL